jgi:hypothetical protein
MLELPRDKWLSNDEVTLLRKEFTRCDKKEMQKYRPLEYYKGKKVLLWTRKPGLGDMVMNAMTVQLLRQKYDVDAYFGCRENPCDRDFPTVMKDTPTFTYKPDIHTYPLNDNKVPRGYEGGKEHTGQFDLPFDFVMDFRYSIGTRQNTIFQSLKEFGIRQMNHSIRGFQVDKDKLVKIKKPYDIIMCTSTGGWKPVRAYNRNKELKEELEKKGFKVFDLMEHDIKRDFGLKMFLGAVSQAKAYIGTETGPTHLCSGVAKKSFIIESGIHPSAFWNIYDRTYPIEADWGCGGRQCKVRKHEECTQENGVCIHRFSPKDIADYIEERI